MSQLLALLSAVLFGFGDFTGGVASGRMHVWKVTAWSQVLGLAALVVGLLIIPAEAVTASDLIFGAVGGTAGLIGLAILYATLAAGTMSVVAPIAGATSAVIPVLVDLASGTRLTPFEWIGIICALAAVLAIGLDHSARHLDGKLLLQAVAAGVGFAVFFLALGQTSPDSGLWPLVAARAVTIPIAMAAALILGVVAIPRGRDLHLVAGAGNLDMGANVAVAISLQTGPVGVNSVLASLYPAFTVLAAVLILRERPSRRQGAGIALALVAVLLLAL